MKYANLAARLYNVPLLIEPQRLTVIESYFSARVRGEVIAPPTAAELEQYARPDMAAGFKQSQRGGYAVSDDGIALIQVVGTLVQRSQMDAMSGELLSYQKLSNQLAAADADSSVRGIFVEVDSPGGEAAGLFEFALSLRNVSKPIVAHANEQAFSAAMAIGVSADEFYAASNGMVGSIGVVMQHADTSKQDEKRGISYTTITYGAKKAQFSPHAPLTDKALSDAQAIVDRLGATFVSHVASMRNADPQAIRDTEAGLLHPDQALSLGLIDGDASMPEALDRLRTIMNRPNRGQGQRTAASADASSKGNTMTTKADAPPAGATQEELIAAARAQGAADATAAATKAAADAGAAQQARIGAILGHAEAAGRTKLATHLALKTAMSVEDAAAMLAASPKEMDAAAQSEFAKHMAKLGNPPISANGGADDPNKEAKPKAAINHSAIYKGLRDDESRARAAHRGLAMPTKH